MGMLQEFLAVILPVVVAGVSTTSAEVLQRFVGWLDRLSPIWKRLLVVTLTFWLAKLAGILGVALDVADVTELTSSHVGALASAGLAYLFHTQTKAKTAGGAT